jgi:putative tryptophan/tyrosine transport system substrate-binding protein
MGHFLLVWLVLGLFLTAADAADAQAVSKLPRLGLLTWVAPPSSSSAPTLFDEGLRQLGYVEGRNITVERRYANGDIARLPDLARDLTRHAPDVILAQSYPGAVAAKHATSTIPIVIMGAGDPVATGLVKSFAHPGGNITGVSALETELSGKRIELLKEAFPKVRSVAVLWNAADLGMTHKFGELQRAAQAFGMAVFASGIREPQDFETVFTDIERKRPDGLFVITDPLAEFNRKQIVELATRRRIPAMYENSPYVDAGGLMAYGPTTRENFRRALQHVDRILKGANPASLPVEQPTKFELVVNLKTAKQIGLTIPPNVLARADRVIK